LEYLLRIPKKDRARKEVSVSVTREECCFLEFAILTNKCVPYFIARLLPSLFGAMALNNN
jgi:hypothetical protein